MNLWSKTRPVDKPYMTITLGDWKWKVLKAYKFANSERKDRYARWFCAVSSPYTFPGYDLGDTYITDIPLASDPDGALALEERDIMEAEAAMNR